MADSVTVDVRSLRLRKMIRRGAKTQTQTGRAISARVRKQTQIAPEASRRKRSQSRLASCLKAMSERRPLPQMEVERTTAASVTLMAACQVTREENELGVSLATSQVAPYSTQTG